MPFLSENVTLIKILNFFMLIGAIAEADQINKIISAFHTALDLLHFFTSYRNTGFMFISVSIVPNSHCLPGN
jgi:hypothetical protein